MPQSQVPDVPDGLIKILQDFTVAILRAKPDNISEFGVDYFSKKMKEDNNGKPLASSSTPVHGNPETKVHLTIAKQSSGDDSENEFENSMIEMTKTNPTRRPSVAAEPYNPDEDDEIDVSIGRRLSFHEKSKEQTEKLREVCQKIMLFNELDEIEMTDLINAMFEKNVDAGEDIIEQLDDADNFYIIESGKYEAKISDASGEDKVVKTYDNFGYFGELALMYNAPRSATITSTTPGKLWALSRDSFRKLVLSRAAKRRREFVSLLHSVNILQDLDPYQRMALADNLQRRSIKRGDVIIKEGDPGLEIFFVMEGTVKVTRHIKSEEVHLTKITTGGYFGELALLSNKPRAASVFAETDVKLAVLGVESFERLLGPCIDLMRTNANTYSKSSTDGLL